ncbi:hypothetical protein [Vibrio sp. 10N.222.52.B12]|uniref:hypothetical protein n=2 Tax=Vibrionaceae TaxID=641 RepID=UPI001F52C723|nr:hypothetical protein [Vibrio sp. 10N.222.52.B12]
MGFPLTNSGSMPISAGASASSDATGQSSGNLSMGNINMGSGIDRTTLIAIVVAVLVGLWLWKKK